MKKYLIFTLLFILSTMAFGQKIDHITIFENLFAEKTQTHNWKEHMKGNKNEISFIFSGLFVVYKEVISSQDIDACVFTPSCSVYAIESIKRDGVIVGYFNAIDRLTRCNPSRNKGITVDKATGKYFDPIDF